MNGQMANSSQQQHDEGITAEQVEIIRSTWARLEPIGPEAARLFYERLFELDPTLRALFTTNITEQGGKLIAMIGMAVCALDDVDELVPVVAALGKRHARYGVRAEHFDSVGVALLWTLQKGLGPTFTPQVRDAWAAVYGLLASTMQAAAFGQAA